MVQLNPLKWGSKSRQKKKDNLRIEEIKESLKRNTRGQGGAGIKRRKLKNELKSLGGKTDREVAREDRQSRKKYDQEHKIINKRGRQTGWKEGYDPSKGVKGSGSKTKTTTKTTTKVKGRKLSPYEQRQAERKAANQQRAGAKNEDWKKMRSGKMTREQFIKKYPRSNTAKKYGKK